VRNTNLVINNNTIIILSLNYITVNSYCLERFAYHCPTNSTDPKLIDLTFIGIELSPSSKYIVTRNKESDSTVLVSASKRQPMSNTLLSASREECMMS